MAPRPSRHSFVGVVQYHTCLKYSSSVAWNVSQWSFAAVMAHDFAFDGASPNHSATPAFAFGEMMWFIHMYMQFGCLASEWIIHVSDQPVEPSFGSVVSTGTLSAVSRFAITCQVVPTTELPLVKAACSFV